MSSGFCLRFVSFLQNYPNLLMGRLHLLFVSARLCLQLAEPFRHRDGLHGLLSDADPDREHNMVAVNADSLVHLTRAVLPAISPAPAPDSRSGADQRTAIANRPPS